MKRLSIDPPNCKCLQGISRTSDRDDEYPSFVLIVDFFLYLLILLQVNPFLILPPVNRGFISIPGMLEGAHDLSSSDPPFKGCNVRKMRNIKSVFWLQMC